MREVRTGKRARTPAIARTVGSPRDGASATLGRVRVELRYNPASGRGKAARTAMRFQQALSAAGHQVRLNAVRSAALAESEAAAPPDLLVLIGGDGTVKHALADAIALGVPVYHVPLGNENLFAREFGMNRDPSRLLGAIASWNLDSIDVGAVEGITDATGPMSDRGNPLPTANPPPSRHLFAIMLSLGPDASVIHRMDRDGRTASGHLAYLAPIAEELAEPRLVPITARVDGQPVVEHVSGLIVVANLRQYGFRVNPAVSADAHDGLLDLVFIPAATVGPLFKAAAWARLGRLLKLPGVIAARGRTIELDAPGGLAQVDGEAIDLRDRFHISTSPGALRVLLSGPTAESRAPRHAASEPSTQQPAANCDRK